jgi:hypothetical protein
MGLDISYYSKIEIDEKEGDIYIHPQPFDYQLGSLKVGALYKLTPESKSDGFRAGSYGGYSQWRGNLAKIAGYESDESVWKDFNRELRYVKLKKIENHKIEMKPFYELIFFSDCEGVIGPEICKKLYQDFVNFEDKVKYEYSWPFWDFEDSFFYFYELYIKWREAFRVASDNGLVSFH